MESSQRSDIVPWATLKLPHEVDGTSGTLRATVACTLDASNDYQAVQTWLALQKSPGTRRTYRKDAARLILSPMVERGRACPARFHWLMPLAAEELIDNLSACSKSAHDRISLRCERAAFGLVEPELCSGILRLLNVDPVPRIPLRRNEPER
ncbi:hypothetical protein J2793_006555 [Paraburkholderia caledonica]|uniref:Integrase n=1 Tax=Paraburkholderia caledonica TaxID=134536 RepID=A0AB73IME3_9BURK|nr:hypothetical protein [Paraburkholderia caledonica]